MMMIYAAFTSLLFFGAFAGSLAVIAAMIVRYGAQARAALHHLAPHGYHGTYSAPAGGTSLSMKSASPAFKRAAPLRPEPVRALAA